MQVNALSNLPLHKECVSFSEFESLPGTQQEQKRNEGVCQLNCT